MWEIGHVRSFAFSALNGRSVSDIRHSSFRPLPLRARSLFADIDLSRQCGNYHDIPGSGIWERSEVILESSRPSFSVRQSYASTALKPIFLASPNTIRVMSMWNSSLSNPA